MNKMQYEEACLKRTKIKMDSNKKEVVNYMMANFDLNLFKIYDYPLLPGGTLLHDQNGEEIIFFWDIEKQKVRWM